MSQKQHDDLKKSLLVQDGITPGQVHEETQKELDMMIGKVNAQSKKAKHRMIAAWVTVALLYTVAQVLWVIHPPTGIFSNSYGNLLTEVAYFFLLAAIILTILYFLQSRTATLTEINIRLERLETLLQEDRTKPL
jgi:hypothetical protein